MLVLLGGGNSTHAIARATPGPANLHDMSILAFVASFVVFNSFRRCMFRKETSRFRGIPSCSWPRYFSICFPRPIVRRHVIARLWSSECERLDLSSVCFPISHMRNAARAQSTLALGPGAAHLRAMGAAYVCGWLTCSGVGGGSTTAAVPHRCWVYNSDGRVFWSIAELIEALIPETTVHWSAEIKRFLTPWRVVFERVGLALETEYEPSLRQVV